MYLREGGDIDELWFFKVNLTNLISIGFLFYCYLQDIHLFLLKELVDYWLPVKYDLPQLKYSTLYQRQNYKYSYLIFPILSILLSSDWMLYIISICCWKALFNYINKIKCIEIMVLVLLTFLKNISLYILINYINEMCLCLNIALINR